MADTVNLSAGDIAALTNGMGGGVNNWMNNPFMYLIWMSMFRNGWMDNSYMQGALTRAEMYEGFNQNQLMNDNRMIQKDLCDNRAAYQNGTAQIIAAVTQNGYNAQSCCCETNRNIDALRYENSKNTCDIITAGERNTQRIIDHMTANEMSALREQNTIYAFQLSQQAQSANLINALRPTPIPAYPATSPYQSLGTFGNCCGF